MTTVTANVTKMFTTLAPWDCSNSVANLGIYAAQVTWRNALEVARDHASWLEVPLAEVCEGMCEWAKETGAWDADEIAAFSDLDLVALFVQTVAAELRECLGADTQTSKQCVRQYKKMNCTDVYGMAIGHYYTEKRNVKVEYYLGV